MAELVDAADSKSVFERSGSSSLPRGTILKKDLEFQGLFFRLWKSEVTSPEAGKGTQKARTDKTSPQDSYKP